MRGLLLFLALVGGASAFVPISHRSFRVDVASAVEPAPQDVPYQQGDMLARLENTWKEAKESEIARLENTWKELIARLENTWKEAKESEIARLENTWKELIARLENTWKEAKESEIARLEKTKESEIALLKESKDDMILKLEADLLKSDSLRYAVEHSRILVEKAAFDVWAQKPTTSRSSPTSAVQELAAVVMDAGVSPGTKLCKDSKDRLIALMESEAQANRTERDVCAELVRGVYGSLSIKKHYLEGLPPGLYLGSGTTLTRLASALLISKAQQLNAFNYDVIYLDDAGNRAYTITKGKVEPFTANAASSGTSATSAGTTSTGTSATSAGTSATSAGTGTSTGTPPPPPSAPASSSPYCKSP